MPGFQEYTEYDGLGLAALIQKGEVSPLEVLEAAIEQTEKVNPALNAVVYKMYEEGKRTLEKLPEGGAFRGVPFLIKDLLIGYKGHPTTASSEFLAGYVSDFDANLVKRYKEAGLVTFGKTNAPEFGILGVTEPKFRGPCRNPWSTGKTPGGSSGGAASAVAARMVPLAHGGDGGGSIRIPASACGLVGLKPSRGRNPMGPMGAESWLGYVVEHVLTRSVRDSAAALDATHGSDGGVPYTAPAPQGKFLDAALTAPKKLRIAFTKDSLFGKDTHRDCQEAVDKAVKACEEMGHTVVEAIPEFDKRELVQAYIVMVGASVVLELEKAAKMTQQELDPEKFELTTWFLYLAGQKFTAKELVWAIHHTRQAGRSLGRFFENYDLLITSTMAHPPSDIGLMELSSAEKLILNVMKVIPSEFVLRKALAQMAEEGLERTPNTQLCNQTGVPAISLPLHWNQQNIPIGVQFIAPFGGEERLLQIAGQLEKTLPWSDRKPPVILK